jgi:hypothetical protein
MIVSMSTNDKLIGLDLLEAAFDADIWDASRGP